MHVIYTTGEKVDGRGPKVFGAYRWRLPSSCAHLVVRREHARIGVAKKGGLQGFVAKLVGYF